MFGNIFSTIVLFMG